MYHISLNILLFLREMHKNLANRSSACARAAEMNVMGVFPKILKFVLRDYLDDEEEHSSS